MGATSPQTSELQPATRPIVELLTLAAPTIAQMASYTVMQFIDTWLLSRLGHFEAAAAGMSGLFTFSIISFGVGVMFVINTLVSQSFGRNDYPSCGRYLWQGIWFALLFSALLLPLMPFADAIFRAFGHDNRLARAEGLYLRIVLLTTFIKLAGTACGQFVLGINRPRVVLISAVVGVACNAVAAYGLILGQLGMPKLGLVGAAWAQNIGVTIEALVLISFALTPGIRRTYATLEWRLRWPEMKTLLFVGSPSGLQVIADVMAWSMFSSVVMAKFGEPAMAANTFMFRFMVVSFMPAFGLGTAITALVGRYIGMGRPDIAARRAHLGFAVSAAYMLSCGLIFFLGRHAMIRLFTDDPEILRIGATMLTFAAVYQLADATYIAYNGALRGAGDTFYPAMVTGILCWSMVVVGGFLIATYLPQWGPAGPWAIATLYGVILGATFLIRFQRGKWKLIRLADHRSADTVPGLAAPAPATL